MNICGFFGGVSKVGVQGPRPHSWVSGLRGYSLRVRTGPMMTEG